MIKHFIIYHKTKEIDIFIDFLRFSQTLRIKRLSDMFLEVIIDDFEDEFDLPHLRELSLQEIYLDFIGFELPQSEYVDRQILFDLLPKLGYGTYNMTTLIKHICINEPEQKELFRHMFIAQFGRDTIDSVLGFIENDMNASKASKALFMHRNTINYRLDNFILKSEINIRTFSGAFALYSLFN